MGYALKWGNKTWIYALLLGLGIGMSILLFMHNMLGPEFFFNYYSPMLGYYVLISICQSHYFRRNPEPNMGGMFRQAASIFGAVIIFFVNQMIMINVLGVPEVSHSLLHHGGLVMAGHFTFIVFGFFIYGFDDFMFQGKLVAWLKKGWIQALFWYVVIWIVWFLLFYMKGGLVQAYSTATYSVLQQDRMLAISQWIIIISLLYALVLKDILGEIKIKNPFVKGTVLFAAAVILGTAIAYLCYGSIDFVIPYGGISQAEKWHHVLYMGTYPLIPAVLMGVFTPNFSWVKNTYKRTLYRIALLIPLVMLSYFAFHFIIAEPELIPNYFFPGTFSEGMGLFGHQHGWHHHLDLYFNFTVSIIPLTHHWFTGKIGFMKKSS